MQKLLYYYNYFINILFNFYFYYTKYVNLIFIFTVFIWFYFMCSWVVKYRAIIIINFIENSIASVI